MSLRDDLNAMERHSHNGTLREWFEGTAPILPIDHSEPDYMAEEEREAWKRVWATAPPSTETE